MRVVLLLAWKEYLHVLRDRATLFQVLAIPIVQLVVLSFAATFQIRDTPVYLVDLDRTAESRRLVARFEASDHFHVVASSLSPKVADEALMRREATMVLQVPHGFERDLVRSRHADVQLVLNAEQGAAAGIVRSYAIGIIAAHSRELGHSIAPDARVAPIAAAAAPRIDLHTRGWYNPSLNYIDYMVPGILVGLVTLIGTLLTAQNIAREKELGTLEQLNVTPISRAQFIAGKLLPFWVLAMGELALGLGVAWVAFGVPMRGSVLLVLAIGAVYLLAALGLGLLISTISDTQQQAMFVTFFVMMIYLLMSGIFTPLSSMPEWTRWLAELNPVKHFVVVMRSVLVKGAGFREIQMSVYALAAYAAAALTLAVRQYSKRAR